MPRRLFLALLLLVAAPMVLLGWMSASAVKANQAAARENLAKLLSSQLSDANLLVVQLFDGYADDLNSRLDTDEQVFQVLRRLRREMPIVRQGIFVDPQGLVLFPPPDDSIGQDAIEVAAALPGLIDARPLPKRLATPLSDKNSPDTGLASTQSASKQQLVSQSESTAEEFVVESRWKQWYMAGGAQVVYWRSLSDGSSVGVLLERSRWIADLIAALPDDRSGKQFTSSFSSRKSAMNSSSQNLTPTPIGSVSLVDEAKRPIYRWGSSGDFRIPPLVTTELSTPLASWQLRLHVDQSLIPAASPMPMYLSLGAIAVLLLAVGFYVLTAVQRQISDAKSRVSFAGQVSHELRTPLTNIRLYTELAESDLNRLEDGDTKQSLSKRLVVIDHESRRLQRLVSGVLEMIRPSGKRIGVRKEPTDIGNLVAGIASQFEPSFDSAGLTLQTQCDCTEQQSVDPDVVEMVLVNLLSNVEKYVPRGGRCKIRCSIQRDESTASARLQIIVCDDGPGIGSMHHARIFRPFVRIDDSISAPSGTGIGLTIARRAAQRHGGDLVLLAKSELGGAAFQLSLPVDTVA